MTNELIIVLFVNMNYVSADLRERHAYVDQTVEAAVEAFRDPAIAKLLGDLSASFITKLSGIVVANLKDGVIEVPDEFKDDDSVLTASAVRPGEAYIVSSQYDRQTDNQKRATLRQFNTWEPQPPLTTNQIYKGLIGGQERAQPSPVQTLPDQTMAYTGTMARCFASRRELSNLFIDAPSRGIVMIKMKPGLVFSMAAGETHSRPEDVAHELTHVRQIEKNPVRSFHSQKSVDMAELRGELEAYHVGAILTFDRYVKMDSPTADDLMKDHGIVQASVERTRKEYGIDPLDPYRPSPHLLRKLTGKGLGHVLHAKIDYAQYAEMVGAE